jgi:hypothetical protein
MFRSPYILYIQLNTESQQEISRENKVVYTLTCYNELSIEAELSYNLVHRYYAIYNNYLPYLSNVDSKFSSENRLRVRLVSPRAVISKSSKYLDIRAQSAS